MSQKDLEIILTRQLASSLAMPILVVDPEGTIVFYNEAAEDILCARFDETGEIPLEDWTARLSPTDESGKPLPIDDLTLVRAISAQQPSHRVMWIRCRDGIMRHIEITSFPLVGQAKRLLGAMAVFWEVE